MRLSVRSRPGEVPQLHGLDSQFVGGVAEEIVGPDLVDVKVQGSFDEAQDMAVRVEDAPERTFGDFLAGNLAGSVPATAKLPGALAL